VTAVNPIRKLPHRYLHDPRGGLAILGGWYWVCPDCPPRDRPPLRRTRKGAKDDLHLHRKRHHTEPGLVETAPS